MSAINNILQKLGPEFVDKLIKNPVQPETPRELAEALQKIGIKRWAPVVGRYFDPEVPEKLRDFIDGEVTFLYYLSELNKRMEKSRDRETDFSEIIKQIDQMAEKVILEDIVGPVLAKEDEEQSIEVIRKAGAERIVAFLLEFSEKISSGPEFRGKESLKTFIRGTLSTLYYLLNLKSSIELEKQFGLRGE